MEIFIGYVFFSIVAGFIASSKGRSGIEFFFLAIFLSPLIGIIAALAARENRSNVEEKKIASGDNSPPPKQ